MMKLDSGSPYHHICQSHEHDAKVIFHSNNPFNFVQDDHFVIDNLNIGKEVRKDGKHSLIPSVETKSFKVTSPPKHYLDLEDSTDRDNCYGDCTEAPFSVATSGFEMVVKENFFTDRIITKVEIQEMEDCVEDNHYHDVKEISIDKKVLSSCTTSAGNQGTGGKEISTSSQTLDNGHNDSATQLFSANDTDDLKYTVFDNPLSCVDKDQTYPVPIHNEVEEESSGDLNESGGKMGTTASTTNIVSSDVDISADQTAVLSNAFDGEDFSARSLGTDGSFNAYELLVSDLPAQVKEGPAVTVSDVYSVSNDKDPSLSSSNSGNTIDNELVVTSVKITEVQAAQVSNVHIDCSGKDLSESSINYGGKLETIESVASTIPSEITISQSSPLHESTAEQEMDLSNLLSNGDPKKSAERQKYEDVSEESKQSSTDLSFPPKVDGSSNQLEAPSTYTVPGGVITFSFDSEAASMSGRDNKETIKVQQPELAQNNPGTEDATTSDVSASDRSLFRHLVHGESNFSGQDFLSGPITNSGHIPYSGSLSLRSDSSTTSARSFAFPILQSEWNSSPVKMAKADRRHLRKHRWRMGLLCCKF